MGRARGHARRDRPVIGLRAATADDLLALGPFRLRHGGSPPPSGVSDDLSASADPAPTVLIGVDEGEIFAAVDVARDGDRASLRHLVLDAATGPAGARARAFIALVEAWMIERGILHAEVPAGAHGRVLEGAGYRPEHARTLLSKSLGGAGPRVPITITDLEMRQRPTRPTPPAPGSLRVSLLRAEAPTVSFYRYLYNTVGAPWSWVDRRLLDDSVLAARVTAEGVEVHVLHLAGVPAGYGELVRAGTEVELAYFGLMPEFIGRGLGWYFINAIVDIAWMSDPQRLTVNTCDLDHPRALRTYQKAGFVVVGRRASSIADPRSVGLPWPEGHHRSA